MADTNSPNGALRGIIIKENPIQAIDQSNFQGLGLKYIELSGTEISELPAFVFADAGFLYYLLFAVLNFCQASPEKAQETKRHCGNPDVASRVRVHCVILILPDDPLTMIHINSLRGVPSLKVLSLKDNGITCLPVNLFSDLPTLWDLDLSDNELEYMAPGTFNGLSAVEAIYLKNNKIQCLHADSFQGLAHPDVYLYLVNNELKTLNKDTFRNLQSSSIRLTDNGMVWSVVHWVGSRKRRLHLTWMSMVQIVLMGQTGTP